MPFVPTAITTDATAITASTLEELGYVDFLGVDYIPEKGDPLVAVRCVHGHQTLTVSRRSTESSQLKACV